MQNSNDGWDQFIDTCLQAKTHNKLEKLFDFFLTIEEKSNLTTRFLLIKELLEDKKNQRQIAKDLNISIAKITRGSNELKRLDPAFLKILKTLLLK